MSADVAVVWCFGRMAGTLRPSRLGMTFEYVDDSVGASQPPLSQSLPLDGSFTDQDAAAFSGGLLPEGEPRTLLARQLGVSVGNDFATLVALGGDTAGAISIFPDGTSPVTGTGDDVQWLTKRELAELIDGLPSRPMHVDHDGTWRLSLAGAQDKLPVVVADDGTVGLTRGETPSTHILKTPIARLADTVANEAFCLAFGGHVSDRSRRHGLQTVSAIPIVVDGRDALLVERYDRERTSDGSVRRLHQEDLCQALGIPTARKYESEGGPTIEACARVLRDVGDPRGLLRFVDAIALSFLVGNYDAHGKNYSLLYSTGSQRARLAPVYDVLSTAAYHGTTNLTRKMAMRIGGEYRPEYVAARHLSRMAEATGLNSATLRKRFRERAERATAVSDVVADEFRSSGWWRPIIDDIQAVIARRAQMLHAIAAAAEQ